MYRFIESIRVENFEAPLLDYHLMRAARTCYHHGLELPLNANVISEFINAELNDNGLYKLRIVYGDTIHSMEIRPYIMKPISSLQVMEYSAINYDFKYEDRKMLSSLFDRRGVCDDILIVKNGAVTDSYYCNIAFLKGDAWLTPSSPLLKGTRRAYLLENETIKEEEINLEDLSRFTHFRLFNAMINWDNSQAHLIENIIL